MAGSTARFGLTALALAFATAALGAPAAASGPDPLSGELDRWTTFVATDTASDDNSVQVRRVVGPALAQSRHALDQGRRGYALLRLGAAQGFLGALTYTRGHAAAGRSAEAFEAEWGRSRTALLADSAAARRAVAGLRPAAVRAMGEAALAQVRVYHDASLEYGRATIADAGLFYIGQATGQREFITLAVSLTEPAAGSEPPFRALTGELDSLQAELLGVYRPPVSIDRHPEFIAASAALKEARELDAAGLCRGALLRYLQAVLRFQPLRERPPAYDPVTTAAQLARHEARLGERGVDHSLGRLFLEAAQGDLEDTSATATRAVAAAVAAEVLPRYFGAIAPAAPRSATAPPGVTVTLVRWPYT